MIIASALITPSSLEWSLWWRERGNFACSKNTRWTWFPKTTTACLESHCVLHLFSHLFFLFLKDGPLSFWIQTFRWHIFYSSSWNLAPHGSFKMMEHKPEVKAKPGSDCQRFGGLYFPFCKPFIKINKKLFWAYTIFILCNGILRLKTVQNTQKMYRQAGLHNVNMHLLMFIAFKAYKATASLGFEYNFLHFSPLFGLLVQFCFVQLPLLHTSVDHIIKFPRAIFLTLSRQEKNGTSLVPKYKPFKSVSTDAHS